MIANASTKAVHLDERELRIMRFALMGLNDESLARVFRCSTDNINSCFLCLQEKLQARSLVDLHHFMIRDARFRPWINFLLSWGGGTASLLECLLKAETLEKENRKGKETHETYFISQSSSSTTRSHSPHCQ